MLVAIRMPEPRTRFLGYRVEHHKLVVFALSACMAGIAGALYVPQVGIINPSEFSPANSIEAVIWVAVGGRGTLIGAAVGAVTVNFLKTTFTTGLPGAVLAVRAWARCSWPSRWRCRKALSARSTNGWTVGLRKTRAHRTDRPSRSRRRRSRRWSEPALNVTKALLYLDAVSVSFDGFKALNKLSLFVAPGEMRAIIGPNGAGKTTMMDVITGKTRPDDGIVYFDGQHDLTQLDEATIAGARHRPQVPETDGVRDTGLWPTTSAWR